MLEQIITQQIHQRGPMSFCDFMDSALYHPQLGYYTSGQPRVGVRGDFYTAPSFSPMFGHLIAKQIIQMWDLMQEDEFTIVEYGAGPGHLCRAILEYMQGTARYGKLRYCIIEKSPQMIAQAKQILPQKVQWANSIEEVAPVIGCVLSNELLDNLSVHRVKMQNGLKEVFVDHQGGFCEVLVPAKDELHNYLQDLKVKLPEGYRTEINLQANEWIRGVANNLQKGFVVTIDYGYPAGELSEAHRREGTLTCYYRHRISEQPYQFIGEQDITAHVNFSALCLAGHERGLEYCGFTDQYNFLLSLGFYDWLKERATPGKEYQDFFHEQALIRVLLHEMGRKFKVLIQRKGVENRALIGFGRR